MKYPVLLPNIFDYPFTYESNLNLKVGEYVKVSFGKSEITGVVWDDFEKNDDKKRDEVESTLLHPTLKDLVNIHRFVSHHAIKDCPINIVSIQSMPCFN